MVEEYVWEYMHVDYGVVWGFTGYVLLAEAGHGYLVAGDWTVTYLCLTVIKHSMYALVFRSLISRLFLLLRGGVVSLRLVASVVYK